MRKRKIVLIGTLIVFIAGMVLPEKVVIPVKNASKADYNSESFWYYPWGKSITHKGIDIFGKQGQEIQASTDGIVIYTGKFKYGGNVIFILGPKWRIHYYAHLKEINIARLQIVKVGKPIGALGNTGNAKGKQSHLHYSIATLVPYLWRIDDAPQGWKKMFYLDPLEFIE